MENYKKYTSILKLHNMLKSRHIPHDFSELYDGYHIQYPCGDETRVCSVIEHEYSYGSESDSLEIMGLLTHDEEWCDEVVGFLSAEEVFGRIYDHWRAHLINEKAVGEERGAFSDAWKKEYIYCNSEKNEPKKPVVRCYFFDAAASFVCPNCKEFIEKKYAPNFCGCCGQALDWSNAEYYRKKVREEQTK